MVFVSFAQNFEDIMLWRALKHVGTGYYIDAGAWSPDTDSVTRAFYDRGWSGINIEPNPAFLKQLAERRPRDINLGVAVSDASGEIELHVIGDTGLATTVGQIAVDHAANGRISEPITVPARRLADVWQDHVPDGQQVHFLKVDVEGHERAALQGAELARNRPWIVVVEATRPGSPEPTHEAWEDVLTACNYQLVYADGLNRFYCAEEHSELAAAFSLPPNVFDEFVVASPAHEAEMAAARTEVQTALAKQDRLRADLRASIERVASLTGDLTLSEADLRQAQRALAGTEVNLQLAHDEAGRLRRALAGTEATLQQMRDEVGRLRKAETQLNYLLNRTLLERLLFRPSGKPKRAFRRMMFHKNGKPRGIFRSLVLHPDGRAHKVFHMWMTSTDYQALPRAVKVPAFRKEAHDSTEMTPRGRYFLARLDAGRAAVGKQ